MSWANRPESAPGYSRAVEHAATAVRIAQRGLYDALANAYPLGCTVQVFHARGRFTGTVAGWDEHGARVIVLNDRTQKTQRWWAAGIERI